MPATSVQAEQAAIMARIKANWTTTPVAWPNAKYEPVQGTSYIQPVVNRFDAFNTDMGPTKTVRHPGLLTFNVRTPLNRGDGAAFTLADSLAALFRNVAFEGLHFRAPTIRDGKPDPEHPGWFRAQVDCPYWRDSVH